MPDTTEEVKAILARALRELEQVIDHARVESLLRDLRNILGVEDGAATAATKPVSRRAPRAKPKPGARPRASTARVAPVPQAKSARATPRARTPAKPGAASTARASSGAPAARSGGRREQLPALVVDQPGITVAQAASSSASTTRRDCTGSPVAFRTKGSCASTAPSCTQPPRRNRDSPPAPESLPQPHVAAIVGRRVRAMMSATSLSCSLQRQNVTAHSRSSGVRWEP